MNRCTTLYLVHYIVYYNPILLTQLSYICGKLYIGSTIVDVRTLYVHCTSYKATSKLSVY